MALGFNPNSAIDMAALAESYIQHEIETSPFRNFLERQGAWPRKEGDSVFRWGTRHDRFWRSFQLDKEAGGKRVELKYSRTIVVRE